MTYKFTLHTNRQSHKTLFDKHFSNRIQKTVNSLQILEILSNKTKKKKIKKITRIKTDIHFRCNMQSLRST